MEDELAPVVDSTPFCATARLYIGGVGTQALAYGLEAGDDEDFV